MKLVNDKVWDSVYYSIRCQKILQYVNLYMIQYVRHSIVDSIEDSVFWSVRRAITHSTKDNL